MGAVAETVVSTVASQQKVGGWNLGSGLSVRLHVLPVHVWLFSGHSGFLPQSEDMLTLTLSGWMRHQTLLKNIFQNSEIKKSLISREIRLLVRLS